MRRILRRLVVLLVTGLVLAPNLYAQGEYAPQVTEFPFPLGPVDGEGLYIAAEFVYYRQTNPLRDQTVAVRGFVDVTGGTGIPPGSIPPGTFVGSATPVLDVNQVDGPVTFQPGYQLTAGWRFRNGVVIEGSWLHLEEAKYTASAGVIAPFYQQGADFSDSFLTAFVFNVPPDFAGPPNDFVLAPPGTAYGIWNAAEYMNIQFTQRFDNWDLTGRFPIFQTDNCRYYGLIGPRIGRIWERFKWRTADIDGFGIGAPFNTAIYSNIVSNNLYGIHIGCGDEYRLGDTPIGTFSIGLDLQAAALLNVVKTRAKYEREDRQISAHHSRKEFTFVPELQANLNVMWFPIEGVQIRVGYNAMAFFNTIASPVPIDFDFGALRPNFERESRFFDGFNAGIGIIF